LEERLEELVGGADTGVEVLEVGAAGGERGLRGVEPSQRWTMVAAGL